MKNGSVLLLDNRDSFTFNLVDGLRRMGAEVATYRNLIAARDLLHLALEQRALIVLSPGPGHPDDAGCCVELVALARGRVPVLGICLGLQAIAREAGVDVEPAERPVHGQASILRHDGRGLLRGLPDEIRVGRYHSLCLRSMPPRFHVHAALEGMVMAAGDSGAGQMGLQFHPESILTPWGDRILSNALDIAGRFHDARSS